MTSAAQLLEMVGAAEREGKRLIAFHVAYDVWDSLERFAAVKFETERGLTACATFSGIAVYRSAFLPKGAAWPVFK